MPDLLQVIKNKGDLYLEEKRKTKQKTCTKLITGELLLPTTVYKDAKKRLAELNQVKREKEKVLEKAPSGKIHILHSDKRVQYYLRRNKTDKSGQYISKSEVEKIKKYVQKAYDEKVLKQVDKEIRNLDKLLRKSEQWINDLRRIYSDYPEEVKAMLNPIDCSDEDYRNYWVTEVYKGKKIDQEVPIYLTKNKERVRSKSELNIANALADRDIPYKYERPLLLFNGRIVYPDFTVLNVKERKVYYWEHRGMMDDIGYAKHAVYKQKSYMKDGIIVGKNLIITEESSANPLGTDEIETIIREFFL